MGRYILLIARILLGAFSILMLSLQAVGTAFVAQTVRNLFRFDLWTDFRYGFGILLSVFCVISALGVLRRHTLLLLGVAFQVLAVGSILLGGLQGDSNSLRYGFYIFAVYIVLWWLHFFALRVHEKSTDLRLT